MLVEMHDFHGWTAGAIWEDIRFDAKHFTDIEVDRIKRFQDRRKYIESSETHNRWGSMLVAVIIELTTR